MIRRIRVELPAPLLRHANLTAHELALDVADPVSIATILDALETAYPALIGTLRDHATKLRRPFIRFFANQDDLSNQPLDTLLPANVADGKEPLLIIGAISGG